MFYIFKPEKFRNKFPSCFLLDLTIFLFTISGMTVSAAQSAQHPGQPAATPGPASAGGVSGSSNEVEPPSCKKIKLEIGGLPGGLPGCGGLNRPSAGTSALHPGGVGSSPGGGIRKRLLEKRKARRERLLDSYKDNMSEMFFLQSKGNVVDLPSFRKRPTQQYLNFLKSNSAPIDILDEVRFVKYSVFIDNECYYTKISEIS